MPGSLRLWQTNQISARRSRLRHNITICASSSHRLFLHTPAIHLWDADLAGEGVGPGAPPGQDHAETHGLNNAAESADADDLERTVLGDDLADELDSLSVSAMRNGVMASRPDIPKAQSWRRRSTFPNMQRPSGSEYQSH